MHAAPGRSARGPRPGAAWVLAGGVGALLSGAIFFGGGSTSGSVVELGIGVAAVGVGAALAAALRLVALPRLDRPATVGLVAVAALLGWTAVTITWSIAGDRSWSALNKGLVEAGLLVAGIVLGVLGARAARFAAALLAAVIGAALVWALLGKAIPALFPDGDRAARLRSPVGYWNGLALLADAALALGLWLGAAASARRSVRAAGALLFYLASVALILTASRAGVVGALVAVGLWIALSPERVEGTLVAVGAGVPAVAVGAWATTRSALVDDGIGRADRIGDGAAFGVLALAGAAVAVVLAPALARAVVVRVRPRALGRAAVAAACASVLVGALVLALAVGNPAAWAWDEFAGGAADVNDPSRLTSLSSNNRSEWWREAWRVFEADPLRGAGAGTFAVARLRYREDATEVTQPHSVPLQILAGGGIVGLGLALTAAVALGIASARSLRRLERGELQAARALVVLPAVWVLHSLVDYNLEFLAVTAPALVATGVLIAAGRPAARPPAWPAVAAAGALALVLVASLASPALSSRAVERSTRALDAGRPADASAEARRAQSLNPLALDPLYARARAAERLDDLDAAEAFYVDATERQRENPEPWYFLGLFRLDRGDLCGAYFALNEAYTLDPMSRRWVPGGPLDVARDAVDDEGACEP
jgi:O-antigen ligase